MKIGKKIYGTVLGVLCIGIIPTFVNAYQRIELNIEEEVNDVIQTDFELQNNFNFSTNGVYKILQLKANVSYPRLHTIFWSDSGIYIITSCEGGYACQNINTSILTQGYVQTAYTFNQLYNTDTEPDYYYGSNTTSRTNIYNNENYKNPDYIDLIRYNQSVNICFGYINQEKTICIINNDADSDLTGSIGFTYNPYYYEIGTSADQITNYIKNSIYGTPSGGGGQEIPVINVTCPTIQQLINSYPEQYNKTLCYSSEKIWSGNGFVNITPKSIFELYPQYTGFEQDINTYYNYCNSIATPTTCKQAFAGKEEQYTLISKIPSNVNDVKLYQYCHLELDYEDKNTTTCTTSGVTNQTIPIENIVDEIIKSDRGITLPGGTQQDGSGNITGDSIFTDIMDGENINITNVVESLQSVYNKITGIFYRRNGVDGIIPDIIVRALLLVILFKIFKK